MAGKLDQSLDDILKTRRQSTRRGRGRRVATSAKTSAVAPTAGVKKTTSAATKSTAKTATRATVPTSGESKIIVTGLPSDVTEQQIKEYFAKTIGPVKKVFLTYGPSGQSRGVSTVVFSKPGSALEAATQLNGVKVDNRSMKIEVIVGAKQAPVPVPPKGLGERVAQTKTTAKAQPKSATATNGAKTTAQRGRPRRGRNAGRAKPKTAEELDAEMMDYFDGGANGAAAAGANGATVTNGTAAPATGGDTGMVEDEIL